MFAVQGWSVPTAALQQQKGQPKQNNSQSQSTPGPTSNGDTDAGGSYKSKKRKRDAANAEVNVTKSNIDGMWRKHIEGQTVTSMPKGYTSARKEQKPTNSGDEQKPPVAKKAKKGKNEKKGKKGKGEKKASKGKNDGKHSSGSNSQPLGPRKQATRDEDGKNGGNTETNDQDPKSESASGASPSIQSLPEPPAANLTPLQQSMRQKLLSSRFRHLNETLYTTPSSHAMELFTSNPELFAEYHAGFSRQVSESWPSNPVDGYIQSIKSRSAMRPGHKRQNPSAGPQEAPLPRAQRGMCTIADLGCGDAQLAIALSPTMKSLNLKIFSFDLHVSNPLITKADISSLPLDDKSVDITIFCLSLMGTNWVSFVEEAWRILRSDGKGECWVSEVKSRFGKVTNKKKQTGAGKDMKSKQKKKKQTVEDDGNGSDIPDEEIFAEDASAGAKDGDETDISTFIEVFNSRGFVLKRDSVDKSNKMFIKMAFVKTGVPTKGKWASSAPPPRSKFGNKTRFVDRADEGLTLEEETKALKPCVYKTR